MDLAKIGLFVDGRGAITTLNQFTGSAHNAGRAGRQLEVQVGALNNSLRALYGYFGTRQLVEYADTWQLINARVSLVTTSNEQAMTVQQKLYEIAQRTRNTMAATSVLYTRMALNSKELGRSHDELLKVTESVNAAMLVSGATGVEAAQGMRQLAQALGAGRLQGDEFRTVMEAMPEVARTIAETMGVTRGELYKLSREGKISTQTIIDALLTSHDELTKRAAEMPLTIGQAFTQFVNAAERMVGILSMAYRATTTISGGIGKLWQNMDKIVAVLGTMIGLWFAYRAAMFAAWLVTVPFIAGSTIVGFVKLASAFLNAAKAASVLSIAGKGLLGLAALGIAAAGGWLVYKEILEKITEATKDWEKANADLMKDLGEFKSPIDEDAIKQARAFKEEYDDILRLAMQERVLARRTPEERERWQIVIDAINQTVEAQRKYEGAQEDSMVAQIRLARDIRLEAHDIAVEYEKGREALKEQQEYYQRFLENAQRSAADVFENILMNGLDNFNKLTEGIKRMFFRMMSELAAAEMMKKLATRFAGLLGAAGVAGATATPAGASPLPTGDQLYERIQASMKGEIALPVEVKDMADSAIGKWAGTVAQFLGPAIAGFGVGSAIGGMSNSKLGGAVGGALGGAAAGAAIGSILPGVGTLIGGAIGGLTGAIGGFLGASKRQEERARLLAEALDNNTKKLQEMRDAFSGRGFGARLQEALSVTQGVLRSGTRTAPEDAAKVMEAMAEELGLILRGRSTWPQLEEAIKLAIRSLTEFGNNLQDITSKQAAYNKLFDIEDTAEQRMKDTYAILEQLAPQLLKQLGLSNLDLGSSSGRNVLLEGLKDIFNLIASGQLTPELLGSFTDKNQLLEAILRVKDAFNDLHKELYKVTTDFPRAMDIVYYENKFGRYGAPRDQGGTRDVPGGIIVHGDIVITNNGDETGEELLDKVERAAVNRGARGGYVKMPVRNV